MSAEFDPYADRYGELVERSIGFSGKSQEFFVAARSVRLLDVIRRRLGDLAALSVLDVGCGIGLMDGHLGGVGRLAGIDLSPRMIEVARRANPGVDYHVGDGSRLPFDDGSFDVSFTACVLHHVPVVERKAFVAEMARVTRPGGLVVVFEHNPLNPLTRLAVARCEFDEDAILLGLREARRHLAGAGLTPTEACYILFFPWNGSAFQTAERALRRFPMGAQYYVAANT
jgi:SAM-dependent methyltransferase